MAKPATYREQVKIENKEDVQFLSFQELWPDIDFSDR